MLFMLVTVQSSLVFDVVFHDSLFSYFYFYWDNLRHAFRACGRFCFSFLFHLGINILGAEITSKYISDKAITSPLALFLLLVDSHEMLAVDDDSCGISMLGQIFVVLFVQNIH